MANPHELQQLVRQAHARLQERPVRVAVVGDIILDTSIEGKPGSRHAESTVPILREATTQETIGGAANIAYSLSRLGVEVSLYGIIGTDLHGRQLQNLLDRMPFAGHLVSQRGWPTPRKDWIYERQDNRVKLVQRIDYDHPVPAGAREELVGEFRAHGQSTDVVILVDHGSGNIGPESLAIIGLAKERQAKVVAISRTLALRGQPLDAIVLNGPEMRRLAGAGEQDDPRGLAARYSREYAQHVFLTLLEEGILVCPADSRSPGTLCQGYPLESAQWMGARDTATAIVAVGLALGLDPVDTGRLASAFRYLAAVQRGNARVLWRDVFEFVGLETS